MDSLTDIEARIKNLPPIITSEFVRRKLAESTWNAIVEVSGDGVPEEVSDCVALSKTVMSLMVDRPGTAMGGSRSIVTTFHVIPEVESHVVADLVDGLSSVFPNATLKHDEWDTEPLFEACYAQPSSPEIRLVQ